MSRAIQIGRKVIAENANALKRLSTSGWYSEWHETAMHPTVTVLEQEKDRPVLYLPDGRELVAKPQLGFRKRG